MSVFYYERINPDFINRLGEKVLRGESTVIIGARYCGKRHVLYLLDQYLEEQNVGPIVRLNLLDNAPIYSEKQIVSLLLKAVAEAVEDPPAYEHRAGDLLGPIRQLASKMERPVILLASNIDGMAHHLARSFLESAQTLVKEEQRQLVAVMSGEEDFHELVYGPKSEFNCAEHFFLQGYSEEELGHGLMLFLQQLSIRVESYPELLSHLWHQTGGNLYLLRIILWVILQSRANDDIPTETPLRVADIPATYKMFGNPGIYGAHIFRYACESIGRDQKCWNSLESLLYGEGIRSGMQESAPSRLELAGVASRVFTEDGPSLQVASPLMEDFLRQHYTPLRIGDLYADVGEWDEAFKRYAYLALEERMRPSGSEDRVGTERIVGSLCASLYSGAAEASDRHPHLVIERIQKLFADGCHYVLGFREITFWRRQPNTDWEHHPFGNYAAPGAEVLGRIKKLLPEDRAHPEGPLLIEGEMKRYAVVAVLPGLLFDQQAAVVVSDLEHNTSISRERERLIKQLLEHFFKAYTHAVTVHKFRQRVINRRMQIETINSVFSIFHSLGPGYLNVRYILSLTARKLRQLEYRRVLFCLVDPEKQILEGVIDDYGKGLKSVADLIRYDLSNPTGSVQSYVVNTKKSKIVENAGAELLADKVVVQAGDMKSFAIIPIMKARDVIGTLLVERDNGVSPSRDEVEDLESFCGQLAIAIEQCRRITLLESGLDKIPDPIFIVDSSERPRYANKAASSLLDIPPGWHDPTDKFRPLTRSAVGEIADIIGDSLKYGYRLARHVAGIGENLDYHGAVVSSAIQDEREKVIGGLLRIQNLTYLYKVFEASHLIAQASDTPGVLRYMLESAKMLGHKWGRLYLMEVDEEGVAWFVSKDCFGMEQEPELENDFRQGLVRLSPRSERGHNDWLCIDRAEPIVFCWKEEEEEGTRIVTANGLEALNWKSPKQPVHTRKKPGDFWIDLPLMTIRGDKVLGKICLHCDGDLQPEDFVFLKVLSETFAQLLTTYSNMAEEAKMISVGVAQQVLSTLAHNIGTRLGGLPGVLADYRDLQEKLEGKSPLAPEMARNNESFKHILEQAFVTISGANKRLRPFRPEVSRVDLAAQVEKTLSSALGAGAWTLSCSEKPFEVEIDSNLFETAFLEIVQNSRDAVAGDGGLRVSIVLEKKQTAALDAAVITYRDNGPGVPPEYKERIFDDFFSRRPGQDNIGTGLGLGFVRRVITAHGGSVYYNPSYTQGAEFIITIPRKREPKEEAHVSHPDR